MLVLVCTVVLVSRDAAGGSAVLKAHKRKNKQIETANCDLHFFTVALFDQKHVNLNFNAS